jgi:hypothetical protein
MPGGPKDYMNDFERLMAHTEDRYDRLREHAAKEYTPDLLARARLAGLSMPAVYKMLVEDKKTLAEVEEIMAKRSTQI